MVRQDKRSGSAVRRAQRLPKLVDDRAALPVVVKQTRQSQVRRALVAFVVLAAMWWMLNPGDPLSWIVGGPTVALGIAAVLLLPAAGPQHISLWGLFRFAAYFVTQTVLGAIDIALRAFNPWRSPQPVFLTWETNLPDGPPRWMFANTLTLLPGTLTADIEGASLTIHLVDRDLEPDLAQLETRIRDLFAVTTMDSLP